MNEAAIEIAKLMEARALKTDGEILSEFEALAPLDEATAISEDAFWHHATLYLALTEICGERRLKPAARIILDKAEYGDPGSIMRGIRHTLEKIYDPDWASLAQVCLNAFKAGRRGTQRWALDQLRALDQPLVRPLFEDILQRRDVEHIDDAINGLARLDLSIEKAKYITASDFALIAELNMIPSVSDENDPAWTRGKFWQSAAWKNSITFEALTDIATSRELKAAIVPIFSKMGLGNPRGLMSTIHYSLEHIVGEDWKFLQDRAVESAQSPTASLGTQYWAVNELWHGQISSYDYPPARAVFERFAESTVEELKNKATSGLEMVEERDIEKAVTAEGSKGK